MLSIPALFALTVLGTVTLPLTYVGATVADGVGRGRRSRRRILLFVIQSLFTECAGVMATGWLWVRAGGGRRLNSPGSQARHYALQQWWADRLVDRARHHLGLRLEVNPPPAASGSIIVLARHVCLADALLPTVLYGHNHDRHLGYVLKDGLQWGPCLDIVGNRLPNVFVDRSARSAQQRQAIADLAAGGDHQWGTVLFPEGTFHTAERAERARTALRRDDPDRAERVGRLQNLLPPRAGGTLAALAGAPDATVHVVAHVGLENMATLGALIRAVPLDAPVEVEVWAIPRHEIPIDPEDQVRWLDELWLRLDDWVEAKQRERT